MSVAAQADLRPLFHVFGILPQDSLAVQDSLAQLGVLPSITVYNRLQAYFDLIPDDNSSFINYALSVYPNLYTDGPTEAPEYGVGWHYLKSLTYDTAEAQARTAILQSIIDLYFPNGAPQGNGTPDVCCLLDTMNVGLENEAVVVTGGVEPYDVSIDITGNVKTITVVDYDGCVSIAQYVVNGLYEEDKEDISIYPNPASTVLYINLPESSNAIEAIELISMNGQLLRSYRKTDQSIDISTLNEGVYILKIELMGGKQINKRVVILR
jgi:hypothetical protein